MAEEETKRSNASKWFVGCTIGLIAVTVLCAGGAFWAYQYVKRQAAEILAAKVTEVLEESNLPQDQVDAIGSDVERLRTAMIEGNVAWEKLGDMEEDLEPLAILVGLQGFSDFVLPNTDLPEEERAASRRVVQRLARGVDEGTIDPGKAERDLDLELRASSGDDDHFRAQDVRDAVDQMRAIVDDAGIPDEPYQMDVASRFRALVDELVGP